MTERLNTTSMTAESAVFSPGADFYLQVSAVDEKTTFAVMARVDANADWVEIDTLTNTRPVANFSALPFVKIVVKNNLNQATAKAWSNP